MDEQTEDQASTNLEGESDAPNTSDEQGGELEEVSTNDNGEVDLRTIVENNKKIFERFKKTESTVKELKSMKDTIAKMEAALNKQSTQPSNPAPVKNETDSGEDRWKSFEEKADLRFDNYTRDEIEFIETFAKAKGLSLTEAKEDKYVKTAISGLREEQRSQQSTPSPSARVQTFKGKTWDKMSPQERRSNWGQALQSVQKKGNTNMS